MHRTEGQNNNGNKFQDGPPGTSVEENWLNAIQEEIATVIEDAGISLLTAATEAETYEQLKAAIGIMITARVATDLPIASTESGLAGSGTTFSPSNHEHPAHPMIIWRMTTNESVGSQDPVGGGGSDWEVSDDAGQEFPLGADAVTESSGVFSFASTGYWSVRFYGHGAGSAASAPNATVSIITNTTTVAQCQSSVPHANGTASFALEVLLKITDIGIDSIHITQADQAANTFGLNGSGSTNITYIVFQRMASLD